MMIQFLLGLAIASEVVGTLLLKESDGFARLWPTLGALVCYGVAFWLLALVTRVVPVGIVYAIWSGAGVVLIAVLGWIVFRQALDFWAIAGMGMIVAGVLAINLLSGSMSH